MVAASTCPDRAAARPDRRSAPLCSMHSPTAKMSGSEVSMKSLTTMPRLHFKTGFAAQFRVWADARGDHDQIGFQIFAAREAKAVDVAVAEQRCRLCGRPTARLLPSHSILRRRYRRRSRPAGAPSACPSSGPRSLRSRAPASPRAASRPSSPPPITTALSPRARFRAARACRQGCGTRGRLLFLHPGSAE